MDNFHNALTEDEQKDPRFRFRVAFVPKVTGRATNADLAIGFVQPRISGGRSGRAGPAQRGRAAEISANADRRQGRNAGYPNFNMYDHAKLVQLLEARSPGKGYGVSVANATVLVRGLVRESDREARRGLDLSGQSLRQGAHVRVAPRFAA